MYSYTGEFLTPTGERIGETALTQIFEWVESQLEYIEENINLSDSSRFESTGDNNVGSYLQNRFREYLQQSCIVQGSSEYFLKVALFQWAMRYVKNCFLIIIILL